MSTLFIHASNSKFSSRDEGGEYDHPQVARASGLRSAIDLLADEISGGERNAAVEISVEAENGVQVFRFVVALSVCPLMTAAQKSEPDFD